MYNPTIKHWKSQSFLYFSFFFWSLPNARYMSFLTCFCFLALMTPILSISFWCLDTLSLILILSDFNLCRYRFCTIFIILLTYNKKFNFKWEMAIVVFHWAFLIQNMLIKSSNSFIWFFYPKKKDFSFVWKYQEHTFFRNIKVVLKNNHISIHDIMYTGYKGFNNHLIYFVHSFNFIFVGLHNYSITTYLSFVKLMLSLLVINLHVIVYLKF